MADPTPCERCGEPHQRCAGHTNGPDGTGPLRPCGRWPTRGARVCRSHGAGTRRAAAKAAVRHAVTSQFGLDAPAVDPGETLLKVISQSAARVALYSRLLEAAYAGEGDFPEQFRASGVAALVGHRYAASMAGGRMEVGEAIRGLVELEMAERKLLADWCLRAVAAGLEERRVRLAERDGALVHAAMRVLIDGLLARGLVDPARRGEVLELSAGALRQVEGEVVERG